MTDAAAPAGKLDIGLVITRTFGVLRRNFVTYFILALLLVGLPSLLISGVLIGGLRDDGIEIDAGRFTAVGLGGLVGIVTTAILQGALIYATVRDLNGQKAPVGESLQVGFREFLPLLIVSVLFGLAVCLGLILLVVPGVFAALVWAVAVPALVAERTGIGGAFSRSADLTKGNRLQILALFVVYVLAAWVLGAIAAALTGAGGSDLADVAARASSPVAMIVNALASSLSAMIGAAGTAVLYLELRAAREAQGSSWLTDVFRD